MIRILQAISRWLSVYSELGKGGLSLLVAVTALVGFLIAAPRPVDWEALSWVISGTLLAALGGNALNQWLEVHRDGRMRRTLKRPLPSGRLSPRHAFLWGLGVGLLGDLVLWRGANLLSGVLALSAQLTYLFFYTPLKTRTSLCTLAGAVSGAIPPVIGWVAAVGSVSYGALILAATLFIWQVPHFLALAWMHRIDYERGGFVMLPVSDPSGRITCQVIVIYCVALLPVCLLATLAGLAGHVYAGGSLMLGAGFLYLSSLLYRRRRTSDARRLFFGSIAYLPLLLMLMVLDSGGGGVRLKDNEEALLRPANSTRAAWVRVATVKGGRPSQG